MTSATRRRTSRSSIRATGKVETFTGWRDPNYAPLRARPRSGLLAQRAGRRRCRRLGGAGRLDRPERAGRDGDGAERRRRRRGFDPTTLEARPDTAFTLKFDNQDATAPHNVVILNADGSTVAMGDTTFFSGPKVKEYAVPALKAGSYTFSCQVAPDDEGDPRRSSSDAGDRR